MAPATQVIRTNELSKAEYSEKSAIGALYDKLSKGIESLKKGDVYTIDEAWEEIDKPKKYKIIISKDALWDIKSTKSIFSIHSSTVIMLKNFSKKIKKAIKELDSFPKGYEATGYVIEGLSIYFKPYSTYDTQGAL